MADKPPIEGTLIQQGREVKLMEGFAKIAERDLIQRLTPIEGEIAEPTAREQGLSFMLDALKKARRDNPRREIIEGEVITPADVEKKRADNATMIVDIGLSVLATGDYITLPPVWGGTDTEKEVRDITPLQIEKKD